MKHIDFEQIMYQRPCFLLGANSGDGFYNCFHEIYRIKNGERLYIIKGGPGTGKSTVMKRLAVFMEQQGQPCELFFCSSDPRSLDGIRFPNIGVAVVDGTSPHVMEPKALGVSERLMNLSDCLSYDQLEAKADELLPLYKQNSELHSRAARFLKAAKELLDDSFATDCECSDLQKAEETALGLCKHYLQPYSETGHETKHFISSASPNGVVLFEETISKLADTIIAIEDEYGGTASVMMSFIRRFALEQGHTVITCPCAIAPERKIDHVIIPSARVAFCTTNTMLPITVDNQRRIHATRFRDASLIARRKQRLRFNRRAAEELIDGACHAIAQAREVHDLIENYYIHAMDFSMSDRLLETIKRQLLSRIEQRK